MSILPKEPTQASRKMKDYIWLFYGDMGTGKSTLGTQFPNALHIICGEVPNHLSTKKVVVHKWDTLKEALKELKTSKDFETVVLDNAAELYQKCEDYICDKLGLDSINSGKGAYGAGSTLVKKEYKKMVLTLKEMGFCVVFICHEAKEAIMKDGQITSTKSQVMGTKAFRECILGYTNFIGRLICREQADGSPPQRVLSFTGSQLIEAKAHLSADLYDVFPNEIIINNKKQAIGYDKLNEIFNKGVN